MEDSKVVEHDLSCDRARTYFQAYACACAYHFFEEAMKEVLAGRNKTWSEFKVPEEAIGCGFHEAVRGVLSHHVVIRNCKIANYHPYPPTPWNANPRDIYGTPGPYEDAVQNTPIFEENGPDKFKGIDIMRAVRSFDPCLPCGVHMYNGETKLLETRHMPMFSAHWQRSEPQETPPMLDREAEFTVAASDRIEELVSRIENTGDPAIRAVAQELLQAVIELHGVALERILDAVGDLPSGDAALSQIAADHLVSNVLSLHGIHPVAMEARVTTALEKAQPYLKSHGGNAELGSIEDGRRDCTSGCKALAAVARRLQKR